MFYMVNVITLSLIIMMAKKNKGDKEFISSLICSVMLCLSFMVSSAGVMTAIHIPVNIISIGIVNLGIACLFLLQIKKDGEIQKYYFDIVDSISFLTILILAFVLWMDRFKTSFDLVFETSDPGVHLKYIMDFVNNQKVTALFFTQVEFGLFIEAFADNINKISVWFEIIYGFNFFASGAICYIVIRRVVKNNIQKIIGLCASIIYMIGYPYNDMLFGFCYLQTAITYTGLVYILIDEYLDFNCLNKNMYKVFLSISCASIGVGYTLFVPVVFCGLLMLISVNAYEANYKVKEWIGECLSVFLFPTILILWAVFFSTDADFIGGLSLEGYIYRNLYSDFFFFFIPAICFYLYKRKENHNLFQFTLPIYIIYYLIFLSRMLNNEVSSYYFYKLNYMGALLFTVMATIGIFVLSEKVKGLAYCLCIIPVLFGVLYISQFEQKIMEKNINYSPYVEAESFFHVYTYNKIIKDRRTQISNEFKDICIVINNGDTNQKLIYIGDWMYTYWFEALTNQRYDDEIHLLDYEQRYANYISGKYGQYAVMEKNDISKDIVNSVDVDIIYENEFAYILDIGQKRAGIKYNNDGIERYIFTGE